MCCLVCLFWHQWTQTIFKFVIFLGFGVFHLLLSYQIFQFLIIMYFYECNCRIYTLVYASIVFVFLCVLFSMSLTPVFDINEQQLILNYDILGFGVFHLLLLYQIFQFLHFYVIFMLAIAVSTLLCIHQLHLWIYVYCLVCPWHLSLTSMNNSFINWII